MSKLIWFGPGKKPREVISEHLVKNKAPKSLTDISGKHIGLSEKSCRGGRSVSSRHKGTHHFW